jgi:hypothetical protein
VPKVIDLAEKTVRYEKALIDGKVSAGELESHVKEIVAVATAASIPITASSSAAALSASARRGSPRDWRHSDLAVFWA